MADLSDIQDGDHAPANSSWERNVDAVLSGARSYETLSMAGNAAEAMSQLGETYVPLATSAEEIGRLSGLDAGSRLAEMYDKASLSSDVMDRLRGASKFGSFDATKLGVAYAQNTGLASLSSDVMERLGGAQFAERAISSNAFRSLSEMDVDSTVYGQRYEMPDELVRAREHLAVPDTVHLSPAPVDGPPVQHELLVEMKAQREASVAMVEFLQRQAERDERREAREERMATSARRWNWSQFVLGFVSAILVAATLYATITLAG